MSATGLDVFDKTLQTTNIWLKEIAEEIGPTGSVPITHWVPCCVRCATA